MTVLGWHKQGLLYTDHGLLISNCAWGMTNSYALSAANIFALNTVDNAFTGNKYAFFTPRQCVFASTAPPGIRQCRWICCVKVCPHVCSIAVIPSWPLSVLRDIANWLNVAHTAWNRLLYSFSGAYWLITFNSWGKVNTRWKYLQGSTFACCCSTHCSVCPPWQRGQCLSRQEQYTTFSNEHAPHRHCCMPNCPVRQSVICRHTLSCW